MNSIFSRKNAARCFLVIATLVSFLFSLIIIQIPSSYAQNPPCTIPPPDTPHAIFEDGDRVYSLFNNNIDGPQKDQITRALQDWNDGNGRGISFFPSGPPPESSPSNFTIITWQWGYIIDDHGNPDRETKSQFDITDSEGGVIRRAVITFNLNATVSPTNANPYYDPNLSIPAGRNSNGFDSVLMKKAKHEIGHGLGIGDVPYGQETPGGSVMNRSRDNCPNDVCNNQSIGPISPCDTQAVQQVRRAVACNDTGGFIDPVTNQCKDLVVWNSSYDSSSGGGSPSPGGSGGSCNNSYSCTDYYTGVWMPNGQGGGYWDMEYDSTSCYLEGCY